ncbi:13997_t:CDS:2 [Dentiscutata heterogama]|uniref:13997_t:CDS:1 n=1 Tax=Dentiscutata heterogama TaxID=1316150 RepID=A0ACA9KGA4_9GLOM|nr:13997_t:CDS:2 [Dentiscutata heterogama]
MSVIYQKFQISLSDIHEYEHSEFLKECLTNQSQRSLLNITETKILTKEAIDKFYKKILPNLDLKEIKILKINLAY